MQSIVLLPSTWISSISLSHSPYYGSEKLGITLILSVFESVIAKCVLFAEYKFVGPVLVAGRQMTNNAASLRATSPTKKVRIPGASREAFEITNLKFETKQASGY